MTNRTSWVADAVGQGLTYGTLIASSDMTSLGTSSGTNYTVLSTITVNNDTALAQFMDISYLLAIASNTIVASANFAFWIYALNQDSSTYGDGQLTAGIQASKTPAFPPCATVGIPAVATTTNMWGTASGIIIPPGKFKVAIQNNSGFALTAGTQTVQYRTYNINLNA